MFCRNQKKLSDASQSYVFPPTPGRGNLKEQTATPAVFCLSPVPEDDENMFPQTETALSAPSECRTLGL